MISVLINTEKDFGIDRKKVNEIVEYFLRGKGMRDAQVSIAFVEPETIRELNRRYRKLDKATTVLAFPQRASGAPRGQVNFPLVMSGQEILGDVIICPSLARKKNFSIDFLLKHGLTNLLPQVSTAKNLRTRSNRR